MRKMVFGRHFSRGRKSREALLRSLGKALIIHGKIVITRARAKAIQKDVEKIGCLAKNDTVSARRKVASMLGGDRRLVDIVFTKIGKAMADVSGGYTRIILLPKRKGDAAEMVRIEWSREIVETKVKTKEVKEKSSKTVKEGKTEKKEKK